MSTEEKIIPYADMHCDTLLFSFKEGPKRVYTGTGNQSLLQQYEGGQMLQFYAVFFPAPRMYTGHFGKKDAAGNWVIPTDDEFFRELVKNLHTALDAHSDIAAFAGTAADVRKNYSEGKVSAMLTIEDGRFINGSMEKLSYVAGEGCRAIALTWNNPNCFGYPNSRDPEKMKLGLTDFGKEAISEMERLHILVDVSHLSDGGFADVAELSKKPFIASHSGCRAVTGHPRNLTDGMIRTLAEHGGVAGVNFSQDFTVPDRVKAQIPGADAYMQYHGDPKERPKLAPGDELKLETRVSYLAEHVKHMYDVGGEDVIAIGTDFDGFFGHPEIREPKDMQKLFAALKKEGFTERVLEKFAYGNVLRVLEEDEKGE